MDRTPWNEISHDVLVETLKDNHMWINAFSALNPTDDLKIAIGEWVLSELNSTKLGDSFGISPCAVLRVNKS